MLRTRLNSFLAIVWRGFVVGITFLAAQVFVGMILGLLGLIKPEMGGSNSSFVGIFLAAVVIGVTLGYFARKIQARRTTHILVWSSIIFLNLGSVMLEGAFFAPEQVLIPIPVLALQQLLVALITGLAITLLFAPANAVYHNQKSIFSRGWRSLVLRFAGSSISYLIFYFVFGIINYTLVTRPYYETHAGGLAVPDPIVVLMVELIRAPLIILSIIPFLRVFEADRKTSMISTGLILFLVGGVAPLLFQITALPPVLLLASTVEIFFQNFLAGGVAAFLLGSYIAKKR